MAPFDMKFSDGEWLMQPGVVVHYPVEVHDVREVKGTLLIHASTRPIRHRGDTLGGPLLTVQLSSPMENVIRVRVEHFSGGADRDPKIPLQVRKASRVAIDNGRQEAVLRSGELAAHVKKEKEGWEIAFKAGGRMLTKTGWHGMGYIQYAGRGSFLHERLHLGVASASTVWASVSPPSSRTARWWRTTTGTAAPAATRRTSRSLSI